MQANLKQSFEMCVQMNVKPPEDKTQLQHYHFSPAGRAAVDLNPKR